MTLYTFTLTLYRCFCWVISPPQTRTLYVVLPNTTTLAYIPSRRWPIVVQTCPPWDVLKVGGGPKWSVPNAGGGSKWSAPQLGGGRNLSGAKDRRGMKSTVPRQVCPPLLDHHFSPPLRGSMHQSIPHIVPLYLVRILSHRLHRARLKGTSIKRGVFIPRNYAPLSAACQRDMLRCNIWRLTSGGSSPASGGDLSHRGDPYPPPVGGG